MKRRILIKYLCVVIPTLILVVSCQKKNIDLIGKWQRYSDNTNHLLGGFVEFREDGSVTYSYPTKNKSVTIEYKIIDNNKISFSSKTSAKDTIGFFRFDQGDLMLINDDILGEQRYKKVN